MKLKSLSVLVLLGIIGYKCVAQELPMNELLSIVDMPAAKIDTLMRDRGYFLAQKEVDSSSRIFYYSSVGKNDRDLVLVRSLTYMDVAVKNLAGRIVTYRTYDQQEYQTNLSYLLAHHFKTAHKFDFKEAKHTIYENGRQSIRIKTSDQALPDGRIVKAYEFEIGR